MRRGHGPGTERGDAGPRGGHDERLPGRERSAGGVALVDTRRPPIQGDARLERSARERQRPGARGGSRVGVGGASVDGARAVDLRGAATGPEDAACRRRPRRAFRLRGRSPRRTRSRRGRLASSVPDAPSSRPVSSPGAASSSVAGASADDPLLDAPHAVARATTSDQTVPLSRTSGARQTQVRRRLLMPRRRAYRRLPRHVEGRALSCPGALHSCFCGRARAPRGRLRALTRSAARRPRRLRLATTPPVSGLLDRGRPALSGPSSRVPYAVSSSASTQVSVADATRVADLAFSAWNATSCDTKSPAHRGLRRRADRRAHGPRGRRARRVGLVLGQRVVRSSRA